MKIFSSSQHAQALCLKGCALTLGNFDGVHLGHQALIDKANKEAAKRKIPSVLLTFSPHPVRVLAPKGAPLMLNTPAQKIELLKSRRLSAVVIQSFTRAFASLSPDEFFNRIILSHLRARYIIVGYDFTFGAKRQGNIDTLEFLCSHNQVAVEILKPRFRGQTLVSSSLIRKYLGEGKTSEVIPLLKRPFFIDGEVMHGEKRGRLLGFPTANIQSENELLPQKGVYATLLKVGGKTYPSMTNIGNKPTFGKGGLSVETHIFNFSKNLYGRQVRLSFFKRLRDEKKFPSPKALARALEKDKTHALKALKGLTHGKKKTS